MAVARGAAAAAAGGGGRRISWRPAQCQSDAMGVQRQKQPLATPEGPPGALCAGGAAHPPWSMPWLLDHWGRVCGVLGMAGLHWKQAAPLAWQR